MMFLSWWCWAERGTGKKLCPWIWSQISEHQVAKVYTHSESLLRQKYLNFQTPETKSYPWHNLVLSSYIIVIIQAQPGVRNLESVVATVVTSRYLLSLTVSKTVTEKRQIFSTGQKTVAKMNFCQEITSVITGPGNKYILDITNGSGLLVRFKILPENTE